MNAQASDLEAGLGGGRSDPIRSGRLVCSFQDSIDVDHAAPPESRECVAQVVERRVRQIEDDAVDGPDLLQDLAGVALVRRDPVDPIRRDIRPEQRDRRGIHVGSVNDPGPTSFRDQDGERPDPGERIRDDLAFADEIGDALAFRGQPGAEVCLGEIDRVSKAVLRVHRCRASFARDDLDRSNAALPLHPAVLHRDSDRRVPPEDRSPDFLAIPHQLVRDLQDRDVPDDVEGAGQRTAERLRYVNRVLVAPDGDESLTEFPLFRGKADVHPCGRREEQTVSFPNDAETLLQHAGIDEPTSDFFPPLPRHDDTPRAHDPRFRRTRLSVFGFSPSAVRGLPNAF